MNTKTGSVTSPKGFLAAAVQGNLKYKDRLDTALLVSERDCAAAGVFTQNQVVAAPVILSKEAVVATPNRIRAVVANSGIANACTGELGLENGRATRQAAAAALGCDAGQVLLLSTGVIGMQLPIERLKSAVRAAAAHLGRNGGPDAARAIMTTDTRPKHASIDVEIDDQLVTIGGMAKGAGMIHPNMATMLGVLTTDAAINPTLLHNLLKTAVDRSFNRISVDGDTSTNDTVLLLANGGSEVKVGAEETAVFLNALTQLCTYLAQEIVRDGEGATKFVEIRVSGVASDADAHQIANTIATSPLVKTAFAGSDPNWGRILAAAGRAGIPFEQTLLELTIAADKYRSLCLLKNGGLAAYQESDAAAIFAQPAFIIHLDLHQGDGTATVWTTDLSHEYVTINADYRT